MGGRDADRGGWQGGGASRDEKQDASILEEIGKLLAGTSGVLVGEGKHRPGAGFLHVAAQGLVVVIIFLDEVGDSPALKLLFEMEELVEIETSRDGKESGIRDTFLVKDLDG